MTNANIMTTSEDIIEWFVTEHLEGMKAIESTLAAKQQMCPKAKSKYCTNCKRTNHTTNECWEEGGGNHASALAWVKKKKANTDKAYMSKDDSGSKTATTALDPMKLRPANPHHLPLSACIEDGYMSYTAQEPTKEKVSLAWNQNTTHGLIIKETTTMPSIDIPFCFDTGATSHTLLFKSDFINNDPIEPKQIHSVNGTSILAIRIGVIKVRCGKGRRFTLNYALYTPQAALHLILVGKLRDEGCRITVDTAHCRVLRNNKVLAKGIREGKHLYHLQCNAPHFECATIACAVPNLET